MVIVLFALHMPGTALPLFPVLTFNHMKSIKFACGIFVLTIFVSACEKRGIIQTEQDFATANPVRQLPAVTAPAKQPNFDSLRATLPANAKERFKKASDGLATQNPELAAFVARASGMASSTACSSTPLNAWLNDQLSDWNGDTYYYAVLTGMLEIPTHNALYFENGEDNSYYGINGEYSHIYDKTFKDLKRFWNIESGNIVTVPIHGSMLRSSDKIIRVNKMLYGDDEATAEYWANLISWLLNNVPQYRNGDHPIFSFNSYAQSSFNFYPFGTVPPKIALGDGIISAYNNLGYDDVAPQAILAHEYGHQVQFQNGVFDGKVAGPEFTRGTELMADAFATYYLSHPQGAAMQWKRVKQFLQVFYNIGDCYFDSFTHHGTPAQRIAAADWGYALADNAQKQGHILTASQFIALFETKLPDVVKP